MENIEILVDSVSKINYSLISNGKRVINFIRLINHDDRSYSSLKVSISFSFDFISCAYAISPNLSNPKLLALLLSA